MARLRLGTRIAHAWNAFFSRGPTDSGMGLAPSVSYYGGYSYRPDRVRLTGGNERSFITSAINRIAVDASSVRIEHVKVDENGRYKETVSSPLNSCLTLEANADQTGRAFIQDIVMSMCDEGSVAIVPTDTDDDPNLKDSTPIYEMRTGKVLSWYPDRVRLYVYNEHSGKKEEIWMMKNAVGIVENPFFAVMNEPNSTYRRLARKLALLDRVDEDNSSGKLDLIVQLPYVVKTPARKAQAEQRRSDIEQQLAGSKYGIAYIDGTEKVTQLNRPIENQLQQQIDSLKKTLYAQLGITEEILNGTANEQTMTNYMTRTVEPFLAAIADEMKRKFLTQTARTQGQTIMYFQDLFRLVPLSVLAEVIPKLITAEILSSNEGRGIIGYKPVDDARADQLMNKNINTAEEGQQAEAQANELPTDNSADDETDIE